MSSLFITLEGVEGVGKTTQLEFIAEYLLSQGRELVITREPGGTTIGEAIRELVLDNKHTGMASDTELLLMFAARAEHIDKVIQPALDAGKVVLCDRFTDASYAYQGLGRNIPEDRITLLKDWVQQALKPDLTLLLDAPVELGLERAAKRSEKDRFESEAIEFFDAVRRCYLQIAKNDPRRVKIIDAAQPLDSVKKQVLSVLKQEIG
ncbi:MAG: dTMP kinase [Gammaproteobacteria bacterium]